MFITASLELLLILRSKQMQPRRKFRQGRSKGTAATSRKSTLVSALGVRASSRVCVDFNGSAKKSNADEQRCLLGCAESGSI